MRRIYLIGLVLLIIAVFIGGIYTITYFTSEKESPYQSPDDREPVAPPAPDIRTATIVRRNYLSP